jgi:RND superfamily putative drug exporter
MIPLAIVGAIITPSFKPTGDLHPQANSVLGIDVIQKHFTAGEVGPLTILLTAEKEWTSPDGRAVIDHLSRGFSQVPTVAEVRSLTQPLGPSSARPPSVAEPPPPTPNPNKVREADKNTHPKQGGGFDLSAMMKKIVPKVDLSRIKADITRQVAERHYISVINGDSNKVHVTRIDVVFKSDPFDQTSIDTLKLFEVWLRDLLPARAGVVNLQQAECYGVTVHARDMARVVARDRVRVNVLVLFGVFVILLLVVRQLWLAGYLLATVLFSYYVTLGLTALFAMWLTGKPLGQMEWRVPFFLFTILVAVGEDYNILLVSRILQERNRFGIVEATRRGLAMTGGTITACGLIMAGTFGTLMLAELSTLRQVGFALGVGILLDTFIVRPFLVPAFIVLVWRDHPQTTPQRTTTRIATRPMLIPPLRKAG